MGSDKKCKCNCHTSDCIDKIKTECIAVNKVFDATIFKTQKDFKVCDQKFDIVVDGCLKPGDCLKIEKEKCKIEKFKITKVTTIVNGETLSSTPIRQPGGIIDIDISDLEDKDCNQKGSEANITQKIKVYFEVKITLKGTVANSDSPFKARSKIKGSITFPVAVNLFIPSLDSAAKPFLSELCNASCKFTPCKLIVNNSCNLILDGTLTFCFVCEKKVKVPVQLCVLTTGLCQPKTENQVICDCDDFPKLFPKEVIKQFKPDCDLDLDCNCDCID